MAPWRQKTRVIRQDCNKYLLRRHELGLIQGINWREMSKGALTYPFAEPKEQISGWTNQYVPKPPSGENNDIFGIDLRKRSH